MIKCPQNIFPEGQIALWAKQCSLRSHTAWALALSLLQGQGSISRKGGCSR